MTDKDKYGKNEDGISTRTQKTDKGNEYELKEMSVTEIARVLQKENSLSVIQDDPDYIKFWPRESDIPKYKQLGGEIVTKDESVSFHVRRSQDHTNHGVEFRIPAGDNDEDLVLMRLPVNVYRAIEKLSQDAADVIDGELRSEKFRGSDGVDHETTVRIDSD